MPLEDTPSVWSSEPPAPGVDGVDAATTQELTRVLSRWNAGDGEAVGRLLPLVYDELRRLARGHLRKGREDHTLQPTALVHEAFVRLSERMQAAWNDRAHFYAVAAKVMRQILVDHARRHTASKRGGDAVKVSLDDVQIADGTVGRAARLLALDEALERLRALDERKARIIELRYFGGLTIDECADVLEVSTPTIVNDTRKARAWLFKELSPEAGPAGVG
ncbi:MAG: sigma-70 family RNA polymerase sigma factor [Acidobacteriota bacterium]